MYRANLFSKATYSTYTTSYGATRYLASLRNCSNNSSHVRLANPVMASVTDLMRAGRGTALLGRLVVWPTHLHDVRLLALAMLYRLEYLAPGQWLAAAKPVGASAHAAQHAFAPVCCRRAATPRGQPLASYLARLSRAAQGIPALRYAAWHDCRRSFRDSYAHAGDSRSRPTGTTR